MHTLRYWSFARILLISAGWVVLCLVLAAAWLAFKLRGMSSSGSGGIGAVAFGFNDPVLAILFVPPVGLLVMWAIARWW